MTEYHSENLDVRVVAYPPVSADGRQRPRALIRGLALQNRSTSALQGEVVVYAAEKLLIKDARAGKPKCELPVSAPDKLIIRVTHSQAIVGGRIGFALKPVRARGCR